MPTETTPKPVTASTRTPAYAISKDGKPYRSFRLVLVKDKRWAAEGAIQHAATNKSKKEGVHTSHLGPLRAAQKIFDAWCRHNSVQVIKPTQFTIQETTRAKASKLFVYEGFREKLETPREIVVTNKATNTQHTIQYAYRSKICAYREGGKGKGAAATAKTSAAAPKKATATKKAVGKKATAAKKKGAAAATAAATTTTSKKAPAKAKATKPAKKLIAKAKKVTAATAAKGGTKGKAAKKSKLAAKATAPAITVSLS
jgi:hypothetical protein